jgi:serine/threonine-protein kinase
MAPEQLAEEPIGTAADLYALAGTTWEMLTGKSPFRAKNFDALREEHAAWEIPAGALASSGAGADLETFLTRCLVRDPAARVADLSTMASWAAPVRYDDLAES